jgi:RNA polymerase sigma-70 factor (ECF subfamily)
MRQLQATRESETLVNPNWHWVYERHAPEIQRYLRRLLRTDDEAAEITQETFARAVGAIRQPDALEGMQPWLFRIATNLALSRLRRRRLVSWIPFSGRELAPEVDRSEVELVRRSLRSIAPAQAAVLVLQFHQGFSRREIAHLLEVSEETVKSRVARGRLAFRAAYERLSHEGRAS